MLLGINPPGTGGLEILEEVKSDKALKHIPMIILTRSPADIVSHDLSAPFRQIEEFSSLIAKRYANPVDGVVRTEASRSGRSKSTPARRERS